MAKTILNTTLIALFLVLSSEARNLRSSPSQSVEDRPFLDRTQSECLSGRYPYVPSVVDALHAQVTGRDDPLVANSIDEANEVYKLVAAAIRETDEIFPPDQRPRFMCLTALDDLYCARNCEYPDLVDRDFCEAGRNYGTTWVANWADKQLQGADDTRFRILTFDPYNEERPLGDEIIHVDGVGRGFATERYFWATNGWLLDPPSSQEGCIGCVPSVPTETFTRGYTLAGGSPTRQGIAVAGVTLPELPEDDVSPVIADRSPQDPDFIHPLYTRIAAICPCC